MRHLNTTIKLFREAREHIDLFSEAHDDNSVVSFARTDGIKRMVRLQIDLHTQDHQDTDKISIKKL